jgi:energy-coupling factor transporter ATP-binding protein EcfA2
MIIGTLLRHYKTYKGIHFIPCSESPDFSFNAYVGSNGIGKSSILEALNVYFNGGEWNINKNSGSESQTDFPFIAPIYLIECGDPILKNLSSYENSKLEKLSTFMWDYQPLSANLTHKSYLKFLSLRDKLIEQNYKTTHLLCLFPEKQKNGLDFITFTSELYKSCFPDDKEELPKDEQKIKERKKLNEHFFKLSNTIKSQYAYVYIPVEINEQEFTQLSNGDIQKLIGTDIKDEIITVLKTDAVGNLNKYLDKFIDQLENSLQNYKYTQPYAQQRITAKKIVDAIIHTSLLSSPLHKKGTPPARDIPLELLSSGEKKKALIEVCSAFLNHSSSSEKKIILAIDEPESSLHTRACYNQFEKLQNLSDKAQVLITTHWYGFIPTLSEGMIHFMDNDNDVINFESYNLLNLNEAIRKDSESAYKNKIPFNHQLKSYSDLCHSIFYSLEEDNSSCYNWIICEGLSDKIYLQNFVKCHKWTNLRVLGVGGVSVIKDKIFASLKIFMKDEKERLMGRVYCLIDTDDDAFEGDFNDGTRIYIRRLSVEDSNREAPVDLKALGVNKIFRTAIEDVLNPKIYLETLKRLTFFKALSFYEDLDKLFVASALTSKHCLRLDLDQKNEIKSIFADSDNNVKVEFAKCYSEITLEKQENWPSWMYEIVNKLGYQVEEEHPGSKTPVEAL